MSGKNMNEKVTKQENYIKEKIKIKIKMRIK